MRELRDYAMFEEEVDWLDVFAENPDVIVPDDRKMVFHIWYGGESHTVHEYTPDGIEIDVFTFGFEKNRLDKNEVLEMIEEHINIEDS